MLIVGTIAVLWLALTVTLRLLASPGPTGASLERRGGTQLVVILHGLSGRRAIQPLVDFTREIYTDAGLLTVAYDARPLSNADVFAITSEVEDEIHRTFRSHRYQSVGVTAPGDSSWPAACAWVPWGIPRRGRTSRRGLAVNGIQHRIKRCSGTIEVQGDQG